MDDDSLLPGAGHVDPPRRGSGPSFVVVALAALLVAGVIGLLLGAVWALRDRGGAATTGTNGGVPVVPTPSGTTPSPSGPSPSVTPSRSPSGSPSQSPTATGDFPPAPASSQQTSKKWHVGNWRITNTGGVIGMEATVTNGAKKARSGHLTMFLYVDGAPLARLTATVTDLGAGASTGVTFTSEDKWGPGTKTLLLVADG